MIKDHVQKQEAGDSSTNIQAKTIIINKGISYDEAKNIAIDVYKSNFLQLSSDASKLALSRAEELTDNFLSKLEQENKLAIQSLSDPGMQSSLFEAQKGYAKTGDNDLEGLLTDILIERAGVKERNLQQIVLDESIIAASKLTVEQMDAITIHFLITKTRNHTITTFDNLRLHFEKEIFPFLATLTKSSSCYEHLEYVGCGSINLIGSFLSIERYYKFNYGGLFCKSFDIETFENEVGNLAIYSSLIIPNLHDTTKYQINAMNKDDLIKIADAISMSKDHRDKLIIFFDKYLMPDSEVKLCIQQTIPETTLLFDLWQDSYLSKFNLTTVGIAIAQANFRRRTGAKLNLSTWVK